MTKQTLYEKIRTIVESWQIAITQLHDNFILWYSNTSQWEIRSSQAHRTIEKCYDSLWEHWSQPDEITYGEELGMKYIWIYERPLWRPKVGDKIQFTSTGWDRRSKKWKPYIVEELKANTFILKEYYSDLTYISWYDCIAPWVPID